MKFHDDINEIKKVKVKPKLNASASNLDQMLVLVWGLKQNVLGLGRPFKSREVEKRVSQGF